MQTMAGWCTCFLLGTWLLLGAPGDASPLARQQDTQSWPPRPAAPEAASRGTAEGPSPSAAQSRSKDSSFTGYVYNQSPDGPAFFEGRKPKLEDNRNAKSLTSNTGEDIEEKGNDSPRNSENKEDDDEGNTSESGREAITENEIDSKLEVPSFFRIASRVTSSTSVSESSGSTRSESSRQQPEETDSKRKDGESESSIDESERSLRKSRGRSRTTATNDSKANEKQSIETRAKLDQEAFLSSVERRRSAYDHFFAASRRSKSDSGNSGDDEESQNKDESDKTEAEEEGNQKSVEEGRINSFFSIATHKPKSTSSRKSEESNTSQGERKQSGRDEESRTEQRGKKEEDDEGSDNDEESEGDSSDDEGEEGEDDEDEGSEEEESDEDESSEEEDGSPAFIVLRRANANSDRRDRNRESAKHFSVSQVGYKIQKDISDEKLLFLPVIDGKDLSISTIRALSSQLSRRGEPIHLEYKELKEGVEGYVAELDNSGTEFLISKLMELIADLDQSEEVESSSVASFGRNENKDENSNSETQGVIPTRGRSSQNSKDNSQDLPTHFQVPQNRFKSQIPLSIKETARKVSSVRARGRTQVSSIIGSSQSTTSNSDSQAKSQRTSTSPFFRIQSSRPSSTLRTKPKTAPDSTSLAGRGSLTKGDSTANIEELNNEPPRSSGTLLPTTIPIEISPVRSSLKSLDEQPRIRIKAELVHSANPNSKARASIKISDEEIKAITNRYSEFLENYRKSRARARVPNSQILRENQARKQLSEQETASQTGQDSPRLNVPNLSKSRQAAPVEIVSTLPVKINEKKATLLQSRERASPQKAESILLASTQRQSQNLVSKNINTGAALTATTPEAFQTSSNSGIISEIGTSQTSASGTLIQEGKSALENAGPGVSSGLIESGSLQPIPSQEEERGPSLVPLTEPDKVKANKVVLISGAASDSREKNSAANVAIPSSPITLISKERVSGIQQSSVVSGASSSFSQSAPTLKPRPGTNRVDHMRDIIRNRLMNILNNRAQKAAAGQSNVQFSLEPVDPSELPLKLLSKMQASRLSNGGVRLGDLPSSSHITQALRLENDSRSEVGRAPPAHRRMSSNTFSSEDALSAGSSTSAFKNSALFSESSFGLEGDKQFETISSQDNIVEESQHIETSSNSIILDTPVVDISSGNEAIDEAAADPTSGVLLPTPLAPEPDVSEARSATAAEQLTGEVGVPLSAVVETHSDNEPSVALQSENVVLKNSGDDASSVLEIENVLQNSDSDVTAVQTAADLSNTLKREELQTAVQSEDGSPGSIKLNIISDETFANANTLTTDQAGEELPSEAISSDFGQAEEAVPEVILIQESEQDINNNFFIDEVAQEQENPPLLSSPSTATGALGEVTEPLPSVIKIEAQPVPLPNVFSEEPSLVTVTTPAGEISILDQGGDVQSGVDPSSATNNLIGLAESPDNQITLAPSDLGVNKIQEIPDFSVGPTLEDTEPLTLAASASVDEGAPQLQEIGVQIDNLLGSSSTGAVSKSSSSAQKEDLASGDVGLPALLSEQAGRGKSLLQETVQNPIEELNSNDTETQTNADLREIIQERFKSRLMQMIKERTQAATVDSISPVLQQMVAQNSTLEEVAQEKDFETEAPPLSTTTTIDSISSTPNETLEVSSSNIDDLPAEQNVESKAVSDTETSIDTKPKEVSQTTIDDEIQKRFQARLMQMIKERANAMLKMTVEPSVSTQKQVEDPSAGTASTSSTIDLDVTTVSTAPELTSRDADLSLLTPETSPQPQTELKSVSEGALGSTSKDTDLFSVQPETSPQPQTELKSVSEGVLGSTSKDTDLFSVQPETSPQPQKELTIIESLGPADSGNTEEIASQSVNQQEASKTDKALQDQLQERLNARLMQMIQDRIQASEIDSVSVNNSENSTTNLTQPETIAQTHETLTETAGSAPTDSQKSDILDKEAPSNKEKSVMEMTDAAIREFMLERFNAGLTTVVHSDGEDVQPTSELPITEPPSPSVPELEATIQKVDLEAAWSHNDQDAARISPQVAPQDNSQINALRESEINERVNSRLMEILQQRTKDNTGVSIAKELGSITGDSVAQGSNLELRAKSPDTRNLQTIEELIAGVEGTPIGSSTAGGEIQSIQGSSATAPANDFVEPLEFGSIPNVRVLSPDEITGLIQNQPSVQTTNTIPATINNEIQLSAGAPEVQPEPISQAFAQGVALKPLRVIRLPGSDPSEQNIVIPEAVQPQRLPPRVETPAIPQVVPANTRQQQLPALPSPVRGSRVLTQEQFISHLQEIESKQQLNSVRSSQNLIRTSSRPSVANILGNVGVSSQNLFRTSPQPAAANILGNVGVSSQNLFRTSPRPATANILGNVGVSSQNLLRTPSQPAAADILRNFGVSGSVVPAVKQPARITENEVFIQPVVRRPQPPVLPAPVNRPPVNRPTVPAFPNARSAKLLTRLGEGDLLRSSPRVNQRPRIAPQSSPSLSFIGSSGGNQFFIVNEGKSGKGRSLQKSLLDSESHTQSSTTATEEESIKAPTPEFIIQPKNVEASPPQLPPIVEQPKASQDPVVTKAKLQTVLTEETLSDLKKSTTAPSAAKPDEIVMNVSPPSTTTEKVPSMLAKSMPSEIDDLSPPLTAVKGSLMAATSIPSGAKQVISRSRMRTRVRAKSLAPANSRTATQSFSEASSQPTSSRLNQQSLMRSKAQTLRFAQKQALQEDNKLEIIRKQELKATPRMITLDEEQKDHRLNSVALLGNDPEFVKIRSRSGNVFTIPTSLFQEFLARRNPNSRITNIQQARTLLQTLFVDGERERLKRRVPQTGTVTRNQLQGFVDFIQRHPTTSGPSARNKRAADDNEIAQEPVTSIPRNSEKTEASDEVSSPKVVFDDRGTYLTDGNGKNIFFQAVDVFYH